MCTPPRSVKQCILHYIIARNLPATVPTVPQPNDKQLPIAAPKILAAALRLRMLKDKVDIWSDFSIFCHLKYNECRFFYILDHFQDNMVKCGLPESVLDSSTTTTMF